MRSSVKSLLPFLVLGLFTCGCGNTAPSVSGTVTIDGKPVPTGSISFVPISSGATVGSPIENGNYQISKLEVSTYRVIIMAFQEGQFAESSADLEAAAGRPTPPPMFRDLAAGAEGNEVEVEIRESKQVLNFPLTSRD